MEDIKLLIEKYLIRKDGNLNSPLIAASKVKNLEILYIIDKIYDITDFLNSDATVAQRWWHIKNNIKDVPTCGNCQNTIMWCNGYDEYCTQLCAVTSDKARKRSSITLTGRKRSPESIQKQIEKSIGRKRSPKFCKQQSERQKGEKNSMYGKIPWNKGLKGPNNPMFGRQHDHHGLVGENNPMFGKSPSPYAGRGISGRFCDIYFRSSLELCYLLFWFWYDIKVVSAESKEFKVVYYYDNKIKTYSPDFYLLDYNLLVEIKPTKMLYYDITQVKFESLKNLHTDKNCVLLDGKDISWFVSCVMNDRYIISFIRKKLLVITEKQLLRLQNNYGEIIRTVGGTLQQCF